MTDSRKGNRSMTDSTDPPGNTATGVQGARENGTTPTGPPLLVTDDGPPDFVDWIHQDNAVRDAVDDGVVFDYGPDTPQLRQHNSAILAEHLAERARRWREITTKSDASDNKRLAGLARNAVKGILKDVEAVQDGPKWNPTLYFKAGKLAGWVGLGFGYENESDGKAALLAASAPWNDTEETRARNTIDNGWVRPILPKIPTEILENHKGIPAETRPETAGHNTTGGVKDFPIDATLKAIGRNAAECVSTTTEPEADSTPIYAAKLLTRSDLRNLPGPEPLIDNVLDQGTTAYLYGSWGTLKTFIALDWAASVATGRRWFGREPVQRKVLYVVGEGASGFKGRVDAWEKGWHTPLSDEWLAIYPEPVNLTNISQVGNLLALIDWGGYSFVILDTLSRCMVGADENSAKDCGVVVDSMTRLLRATPNGRGVILGVHHAGKDGTTFRGSTTFEAGADTVYFTSRDEEWVDLSHEKRKDGPEHDHHLLKLDPMPGTNSAVLCAGRDDDKPARDVQQPTFTTMQLADIVYRVISDQPDQTVGSLRGVFAAMRLAGQTFRESSIRLAVDTLVLAGRLVEVPGKRNAIGYRAVSTAAGDTNVPPDLDESDGGTTEQPTLSHGDRKAIRANHV